MGKFRSIINDIKREAFRKEYTLEKILLNTEKNFEKSLRSIDDSEDIDNELYSATKSAICRSDNQLKFHTFEVFNINKLVTLHEYLEDEVQRVVPEKREWFDKQRKLIFKILLDNSRKDYYVKDGFLYKKVVYKTNNFSFGRLYAQSASAQYLSKEVRYFLLNKEYKDFDIVNSQFSILHSIADIYRIEVPHIHQYVTHREAVLKEKMTRDKISRDDAKKNIIIAANTTEFHARRLGYFCDLIYKDVDKIRTNALLLLYHTSKNIRKQAHSIPKIKLLGESNSRKFLISLQSMICQSRESTELMFFYNFLEQEIATELTEHYKSVIPFYDYEFDRSISFICVYDGALIKLGDIVAQSRLETFTNKYNENQKWITFTKKSLEASYNNIDIEKLEKYYTIRKSLSNTSVQSFNKMLKHFEIKSFSFPKKYVIKPRELSKARELLREYRYSLYEKLLFFSTEELILFLRDFEKE